MASNVDEDTQTTSATKKIYEVSDVDAVVWAAALPREARRILKFQTLKNLRSCLECVQAVIKDLTQLHEKYFAGNQVPDVTRTRLLLSQIRGMNLLKYLDVLYVKFRLIHKELKFLAVPALLAKNHMDGIKEIDRLRQDLLQCVRNIAEEMGVPINI